MWPWERLPASCLHTRASCPTHSQVLSIFGRTVLLESDGGLNKIGKSLCHFYVGGGAPQVAHTLSVYTHRLHNGMYCLPSLSVSIQSRNHTIHIVPISFVHPYSSCTSQLRCPQASSVASHAHPCTGPALAHQWQLWRQSMHQPCIHNPLFAHHTFAPFRPYQLLLTPSPAWAQILPSGSSSASRQEWGGQAGAGAVPGVVE
jgi:hypothetical protein